MKYKRGSLASLAVLAMLVLGPPAWGQEDEIQAIESVEERRLLLELEQKKQALKQREKQLRVRESELKSLQQEVEKKLAELQQRRTKLEKMLQEKSQQEMQKVKELSGMYAKMDAANAAAAMEQLELELAVGILGNMRDRSAGKILDALEGSAAARITKAYSRLEEDQW